MESTSALKIFAALSAPPRLAALRLLIAAGPDGLSAGEIARRLDVRMNTLSANLSSLREAGLVQSRRDGRSIIYAAEIDQLHAVIRYLVEDCCGGAPELCTPLLSTLTCGTEGSR